MNPFSTEEDQAVFLAFRRGIEMGDRSLNRLNMQVHQCGPNRGLHLARWLPELHVPWTQCIRSLSEPLWSEEGADLILPYESFILPGARGRLGILASHLIVDLAPAESVKLERDLASDRERPFWLVSLAPLIDREMSAGAVKVCLASIS